MTHTIHTPSSTGETVKKYYIDFYPVSYESPGQSGSSSDFLLPTFAASLIKCQYYHVTFSWGVVRAHTYTHKFSACSSLHLQKKAALAVIHLPQMDIYRLYTDKSTPSILLSVFSLFSPMFMNKLPEVTLCNCVNSY